MITATQWRSLSILALAAFLCPSLSLADEDWRGWSYLEWVAYRTDTNWIDISQENRRYENFHQPAYNDTRLRLHAKVNSWLNASVGQSYVRSRAGSGKISNESRPTIELRPHVDVVAFALEYRSRLDMREIFDDDKGTVWEWRHRILAQGKKDYFPVVQPVISNETYYDLREADWNQNRFFVGVSFAVAEGIELSPQFGVQSVDRGDHWDNPRIAYIGVKFNLPVNSTDL